MPDFLKPKIRLKILFENDQIGDYISVGRIRIKLTPDEEIIALSSLTMDEIFKLIDADKFEDIYLDIYPVRVELLETHYIADIDSDYYLIDFRNVDETKIYDLYNGA